jgi:cyclohexanecarboxylate-CoA ligase
MTATPTHRPLPDDLDGQHTPIDDATAAAWRAAGRWADRSIRSLLSQAATTHPGRTALVGHRTDGTRVSRTYRELTPTPTTLPRYLRR